MVVRLRIRIRIDGRNVEVIVLLNSGFEVPTPSF